MKFPFVLLYPLIFFLAFFSVFVPKSIIPLKAIAHVIAIVFPPLIYYFFLDIVIPDITAQAWWPFAALIAIFVFMAVVYIGLGTGSFFKYLYNKLKLG